MKDYLESENARNKVNAGVYQRLVQMAFGKVAVMVGHHIAFEKDGDLQTENEIPSADTLLFDHDVMFKVFGDNAYGVMRQLSAVPCTERERLLVSLMEDLGV